MSGEISLPFAMAVSGGRWSRTGDLAPAIDVLYRLRDAVASSVLTSVAQIKKDDMW